MRIRIFVILARICKFAFLFAFFHTVAFMFKKTTILTTFLLIFFAAAPFLGNLHDPFVSDDWDFLYIAETTDKPLWQFFGSNYYGEHSGGSYRPMVNVFWITSHALFGLNPFGYHTATLVFHIINTLLIFIIIKNLPWFENKKKQHITAWAAAFLFTVLQNHAEAINWLAVINDTMMTMFYLFSLLCFLCAFKNVSTKRWLLYIGSLVFFCFSLLTKEMAISLPVVLGIFVLFDRIKTKAAFRGYVYGALLLVPYLAAVGIYFLVRYHAIGIFAGSYVSSFTFHPFLLWRSYVTIILSHVASDMQRTNLTTFVFNHQAGILWGSVVSIVVLLFATFKRKWSWFGWGVGAAFLVSIAPVMQFGVNYTPMYFSEEGERYAYLPSIFFVVLVALFFVAVWYRFHHKYVRSFVAVCFVLLVGFNVQHLLTKNIRWGAASALAEQALDNAVATWQSSDADGIVLVGIPDQYHGAFVFRNVLQRAMKLRLGDAIDPSQVLMVETRTMYDPEQSFAFERVDEQTFLYKETGEKDLIVSVPEVEFGDYSLSLIDPVFELRSISHTHFSDELELTFSEAFLEDNRDKHIDVWFFSGGEWLVAEL